MPPTRLIIDVDTGGDDAVAILLAGHHPAVELVAVTCVEGNAPLHLVVRNTLAVLEQGGLPHVPVYAGIDRHMHTRPYPRDLDQKRELKLPEPTLAPAQKHAVDFLIDYYMGPDGPNTLLAPVAPLTNIAMALLRQPALAGRIPRMVMMGGAYIGGNTTPSAEFNIYADPEAARIVFNAGIPISMVGLEVTGQALITPAQAERIAAFNTPGARVAGPLIAEEVGWFVRHLGAEAGQVYDACAVAAIIEPEILQTRPAHCDIELTGELTRGRTVCDFGYRRRGTSPNVDVGVGINRDRFLEILHEAFAG
ncbi:MAG: nucleoside hydrolase [Anaerolineae bacterium]